MIAIFLFRVLMWQKQQISLSVGYKTARLKQETGNDCDVISGLQASRKTDFSDIFLFSYNQRTIIAHNKKMTKKSVFREAWSPEMTSQSFPVSSFWSRGFVPHRKWNLASKHGKGKSLWKFFSLLYISSVWWHFLWCWICSHIPTLYNAIFLWLNSFW